ncbi:tripartite tricarboxylate transporter substrate binding protein [Imbroritus primus]|uniref:Tripartite tricarboxylate transporter substrate binding protein n=1 Tax=Imbroritus primus TaxID=3058603 RepID=A0ACD3SQ21_9BURK|nr:tripartite tricarboxylate transporter substrate binding protein [Burkholderiaceae bacterium PBA]
MKARFILAAILASALPFTAAAQNVPTRIIVPFTAGGATDTVARGLASRLSQAWNQTVLVENKPGAAGTIGARQVANAAPDGRTLLIVASGHAINELVHEKLPYRTVEDFTAIAQVVDVPNVLLVPKNSPYKNVMELVAASKDKPNLLSYGTSGIGTSVHLAGELFKSMSGAHLEAIFFKGDSESLTNVMGAHVPVSINTVPGAKEQIDAGNVRALAVTSRTRVPVLGSIPTIAESGVPGYDMSTWFGILGPKGMDPAVVKRINADIRAAMTSPEVSKQLSDKGMIVRVGTPADFDQLIRSEIGKWKPIVDRLGLRGKS